MTKQMKKKHKICEHPKGKSSVRSV